MSRFTEEMKVVPRAFWLFATALCVVLPILAFMIWAIFITPAWIAKAPPIPVLVIYVLIAATLFVYIVLLGYIAGDARRRGMSALLWVLLAIFIPSGIGIILYFILRDPLMRTCPACGFAANSVFAFCPSCGTSVAPACPSCRSTVEPGWAHCARCGATLRPA